MSNKPSNRSRIIPGQVRLECRVAVWTPCPLCHREHSHILTAHDRLLVPGLRYWRVDCQGASYFLRVSSTAIASAISQAAEIAAQHGLNENWRISELGETSYACSGAE